MGFCQKSFLIFLLILSSCRQPIPLESKNLFDIKINRIDIWFDIMPKINSTSLLHLEIDLDLKNISDTEMIIDSMDFEVILTENSSVKFKTENTSQTILKAEQSKNFYYKFFTNETQRMVGLQSRKSPIFMTLFFKLSGNSLIEKILIGEKEIQMVY